jgi:hypothetical protein
MDYATKSHIRDRVAQMARAKQQQVVRAQDLSLPSKEKPQFVAVFLFTAIILLAVASGMMMFWGKDKPVAKPMGIQPRTESPVSPVNNSPLIKPQPSQPSQVEARLAGMEERMKTWQYRVWLLGLANNENVAQLHKMDADHHKVENRGFVTFDSNWALSKVPESMQLNEEQRQQIQHGPK